MYTPSKNKFKLLAKKIASTSFQKNADDDAPSQGRRSPSFKGLLRPGHSTVPSKENLHMDSNKSSGELSPNDANSSLGGSDVEIQHKKKGLVYQKTENFYTRLRDWVAMRDVFVARGENPPFVACLRVSVWVIPVFVVFCFWDTLAVTVFEIPHLSTIEYPGFLLVWHFIMMILAMYGFMLSLLSSGFSPRTKLAALSLGLHYLLLAYRLFMELNFNGYRGQWKVYFEKTLKVF